MPAIAIGWVIIIIFGALSPYSSIIRILLSLEILMLIIIIVTTIHRSKRGTGVNIFYLIIIFRVVEAVIGLSLLVRLGVAKKNIVSSLVI